MKYPPARVLGNKRSDAELDARTTRMSEPFARIRPRLDKTIIWFEDWNLQQTGPLFHNSYSTPLRHTEAKI